MSLRRSLGLLLLPAFSGLAAAQGDPAVIERILAEGKDNSHVWETLEYISYQIGPRLTGSTKLAHANAWTRDEFRRLGLTNCANLKWGEVPVRFDRGPCSAKMIAPVEREFEFTARSWSAGTEGPVTGPVVKMPTTDEELATVEDQLAGAWVLSESTGGRRRGRRGQEESDEERVAREARERIQAAVNAAGIAGTITGSRNDLVITGGSWRNLTMDDLPQDVSIQVRRSDFEAMTAELDAGKQVEVEIDLAHFFIEGPFPVYNTVAEIRGTEKPDEVIILSAHLDSWDGPGSTGTQDNGTGSSVMLEAARILMAAGVQPKRTIRFCLWTGEEQGLHGSQGYVASLSDEEKAKISAAFVDDGGTNYQGGLACIAEMSPMLDLAIAPVVAAFPDFEVANSVQDRMPRGGASDHASFNRAGIPGFFWIEKGSGGREEKDYRFIHHTQHDTTRYAVEEYLIQSATCSAVVAYNLAQADTLLPREVAAEEGVGSGGGGEALAADPTFQVLPGGLTGPWVIGFAGDEAPDFEFTVDLQTAKDGRVRGLMRSGMGESKIDGTWDAATKQATLTMRSERGARPLLLALDGEKLKGTLNFGREMDVVGTRLPTVATPISGNWSAHLAEVDATISLRLEVGDDGVLRGWFKSSQSDSPLYKGTWNADAKTLSFEYDYPHAGRLAVSAKLEGEAIVGTIGEGMQFKATRADG